MKLEQLKEAEYDSGFDKKAAHESAMFITGMMLAHYNMAFDCRECWEDETEETQQWFEENKEDLLGSVDFRKLILHYLDSNMENV